MRTQQIGIRTLLIFGAVLFSREVAATELQIPVKCFVEVGLKERSWDCTTYNSKDPRKTNKTNICRFEAGRWTQGSLTWKANKYIYKPARTCTAGVEVKTIDPNNSVRGPRANNKDPDVYRTFQAPGNTRAKGYVSYRYREEINESGEVEIFGDGSSAPNNPGNLALSAGEVPIACYTQFAAYGSFPANPLNCTTANVNDATFCELREFQKPYSGYQGWWWVHYAGKNKTYPRICVGGVQTMKLTQNQVVDGPEGEELVTGKQKTQIRPENYRWDTESDPQIKEGTVVGCYLAKAKDGSPTRYVGCSQGGCKLGEICSNPTYPLNNPVVIPSSVDISSTQAVLQDKDHKPYTWAVNERVPSGACHRFTYTKPYRVKTFDFKDPSIRSAVPTWQWNRYKCVGGIVIAHRDLEGELVEGQSVPPSVTGDPSPTLDRLFKPDGDSFGFGPMPDVLSGPRTLNIGKEGVGINGPLVAGSALNVVGKAQIAGDTQVTGNFTVTGPITATGTVASSSDSRLKRLVAPIQGALDKVLSLRGVTYFWKKKVIQESQLSDVRQLGLIAQEVEPIVPEAVKTDARGMKSVTYPNLVALLVEAIKEQQHQIEQLKKDRESLERRIQAIEASSRKK